MAGIPDWYGLNTTSSAPMSISNGMGMNPAGSPAPSAGAGVVTSSAPSSMGMASMGMQVAGAITSVIGTYYSAQASKSQLAFQAAMADTNARIAEKNAQQTLLAGQREEQNVRRRTGMLKSEQRVAMAANGIVLGEGTAANIIASTDISGEIDANTVALNALRSAWGYRTQGTSYSNEAVMSRANASAINPNMNAASSLIGNASNVAGNWYQMKKIGAI
jgi:hypothetical protein